MALDVVALLAALLDNLFGRTQAPVRVAASNETRAILVGFFIAQRRREAPGVPLLRGTLDVRSVEPGRRVATTLDGSRVVVEVHLACGGVDEGR